MKAKKQFVIECTEEELNYICQALASALKGAEKRVGDPSYTTNERHVENARHIYMAFDVLRIDG